MDGKVGYIFFLFEEEFCSPHFKERTGVDMEFATSRTSISSEWRNCNRAGRQIFLILAAVVCGEVVQPCGVDGRGPGGAGGTFLDPSFVPPSCGFAAAALRHRSMDDMDMAFVRASALSSTFAFVDQIGQFIVG